MKAYDFTIKTRDGRDLSLSDYRGKVLLIVNTATECGFTPQYADLETLYGDLGKKGLEILDFPCNQFGGQAPGTAEEIHTFCTGRFGITFPQFAKVEVNGENAAPLYRWLTENTTFQGLDQQHPIGALLHPMLKEQDADYEAKSSIKWNFTKFLIDREGNIAARFEPTAAMEEVRAKIESLL